MAERGRVPGSADGLFTRREILRRGVLGAAGLAAGPAVLAALSVGANGDRAAAMEPAVDFTVTMVGLMLIGGLGAVVGLIVWGVSQAAR